MTVSDCCGRQDWQPVADFGHASGVDLDLGQCANCGKYVMAVVYTGPPTYVVLGDDEARRLLSLRDRPHDLKIALKKWFDS